MTSIRRVVLFGTESTGKTRLAQALAVHFGEPWAPEFVRDYWDAHGGRVGPGDLDAIARGQIDNEERATARAKRVVFCDTDLLTCTVWNDLLFPGACPRWVREEADRRARSTALYLLCAADVPFEPDPQRCFPDEAGRAGAAGIFKHTLVSRKLPFGEIVGEWKHRQHAAIAAVEKLLGGS
jgi:HTH-type transcriptional regulator, transcriptional repressor of NAD biosynthesis genes